MIQDDDACSAADHAACVLSSPLHRSSCTTDTRACLTAQVRHTRAHTATARFPRCACHPSTHLLASLLDLPADDELIQDAVHLRGAGAQARQQPQGNTQGRASRGRNRQRPRCTTVPEAGATARGQRRDSVQTDAPSRRTLWKPNTRSSSHTLPK